MLNLLDNDHLQKLVDYSFGDHSGVLGGIPQSFMKKANIQNEEFVSFLDTCTANEIDTITLFIDNIRLYRRPIEYSDWLHLKPVSAQDRLWLNQFEDEDLLELCGQFPDKKFIIFTAFEDTPLDDYIWDKIPENVVAIHAANAVVFGGKVHPFPHGIERKMHSGYNHHEVLQRMMETEVEPTKLLFVAHRADTGARASIGSMFQDKPWATVTHLPYEQYLREMQNHKFVLCPSGNGIESSRNWETLYMGRVPIFKKHPYLRAMFNDFPVLWVNEFDEIDEKLLKNFEYLFDVPYDRKKLDLLEQFNQRTNV
jgi:hypothetical protein